jgi:hypothetical protein
MSTTNDAMLYNLGVDAFPVVDNLAAMNANAQNTATPLLGAANRVVTSVSNGSCILPSILSNASSNALLFVVNDSPNTIKVYPAAGENQNGVANATLSVPTGQSAIFMKVPPATSKGGGGGGTTDWRSAVIA